VCSSDLDVYRDTRGFFLETYHAQKYGEAGIPTSFVQDNHSRSVCGSLRGLHAQLIQPQGKLVRVIDGEIFDVAVDIRRGSPKFGTWLGVFLSSENFRQMYIPPGFAHGFCVVSEVAEVEYKCTDFYYPGGDLTISWNDPEIGISWPIRDPMLSEKDGNAASLKDLLDRLPLYEDI
jgi:dTDP-4-dehydrorhamnose 3,5-epimerase